MRLYKEFNFEAAHFLPSAPKGHANARIHGHSFHVRVTLEGEPKPENGLIMQFGDFATVLLDVKDKLDHRFLNEIEGLETPTLERLTAWIWREIEPRLPGLCELRVSRPSLGEGCILTREHNEVQR